MRVDLSLAETAQAVMTGHAKTVGAGPLILWRRRRDYVRGYDILSEEDDPLLWVTESVGTALCVGNRFYRANTLPGVAALMGQPWTFSGLPAPGETVTLTTANGRWTWLLTDDRSCCGGYLARWPD